MSFRRIFLLYLDSSEKIEPSYYLTDNCDPLDKYLIIITRHDPGLSYTYSLFICTSIVMSISELKLYNLPWISLSSKRPIMTLVDAFEYIVTGVALFHIIITYMGIIAFVARYITCVWERLLSTYFTCTIAKTNKQTLLLLLLCNITPNSFLQLARMKHKDISDIKVRQHSSLHSLHQWYADGLYLHIPRNSNATSVWK